MHGNTAIARFDTLDGLQGCTGGIINGLFHGLCLADTATGIDTGSPGLIRKTDEMRISIAVKQIQIEKGRSLAIGQVDWRASSCGRHHTGSQDNHINIQAEIFTQQGIFGLYNEPPASSSTLVTEALVMKMPSSFWAAL